MLTVVIQKGNISQWGEVKKKNKDRARSRVNDHTISSSDHTTVATRGRGRGGFEGQRGGRGRGADRGRGSVRGLRGGLATNGSRAPLIDKGASDSGPDIVANMATSDSTSAWEAPVSTGDTMESSWDQPIQPSTNSPDASSWEMVTPAEAAPAPAVESQKPSSKPDGSRSWASIFNKPTPPQIRTKAAPPLPTQDIAPEPLPPSEVEQTHIDEPGLPPPVAVEDSVSGILSIPTSPGLPPSEPAGNITPSKDDLTETNLEQVLDMSNPPATATAASTVGTTIDPRSSMNSATPLHASQQHSAPLRPSLGGFATSAYKATSTAGRSASFQRRVLEQREAVVMPSNHAVDRATVQFGSMGLNGTSEDLDVDDEREEAETRTQPPQYSPIAPKATLPPAPQQPNSEPVPTPRQAPGLPPLSQQPTTSQQPFGHSPPQPSGAEQGLPQSTTQNSYPYNQFNNRYVPPVSQPIQADVPAPVQKTYEPFGQQIQQSQPHAQQQQYDSYPTQPQTSSQQQQSGQQAHAGGYTSAAYDYSSYYTSDNQRNAFQNQYTNYGQPAQPTQQDVGNSQQRTGSAFGNTGAEVASQYSTSHGQHAPGARYGQSSEAHASGHSTPNPILAGQHAQSQAQPPHHVAQQHSQGQAGSQHGAYPYGHPYYNSPYYSAYMNQVSSHHSYGRDRPMFDDVRRYDDQYLTHNHQFGYGGNQGGYGGGPFAGISNKQGMYGQPHQGYGMSPQPSYEQHSASPANAGGYGHQSMPTREGAPSGGLGGYGRTSSTQASESQQHSSGVGAFGGMPDVFGRSQSGFSNQNQGVAQQQVAQGTNEEAGRGFGDTSKVPGGPSPAAGQPSGRPGSAANSMQGQTGLGSQNQSQQGYGGYPNHMNHQMQGQQISQYGAGHSGLGGHHQSGAQGHQAGGYGGGYGAGFGGSYYGNSTRGGWGGNYGH